LSLVPSQAVPAVSADVSWLPLGVTGLSPATVNAWPSPVGCADLVGCAEPPGAAEVAGFAEAVGLAETVVVTGAGPVGVGVAEQAADSAATVLRAATVATARAALTI
jgi:hypothetical protein